MSQVAETIVLKVRLIRGKLHFLVLGKECSQLIWVLSFMTKSCPACKLMDISSFVVLWRKENLREAPRLSEAIAPKGFNVF